MYGLPEKSKKFFVLFFFLSLPLSFYLPSHPTLMMMIMSMMMMLVIVRNFHFQPIFVVDGKCLDKIRIIENWIEYGMTLLLFFFFFSKSWDTLLLIRLNMLHFYNTGYGVSSVHMSTCACMLRCVCRSAIMS